MGMLADSKARSELCARTVQVETENREKLLANEAQYDQALAAAQGAYHQELAMVRKAEAHAEQAAQGESDLQGMQLSLVQKEFEVESRATRRAVENLVEMDEVRARSATEYDAYKSAVTQEIVTLRQELEAARLTLSLIHI